MMGTTFSIIDIFRDSSWQLNGVWLFYGVRARLRFLGGIYLELPSIIQLKQEYGN